MDAFYLLLFMSIVNLLWCFQLNMKHNELRKRDREIETKRKDLARWEWSLERRESRLHKTEL